MVVGSDGRVPRGSLDVVTSLAPNEDTTTILQDHYKPAVSRKVHMETARYVSREEDDRLKDTWEESVILPDESSSYCQPLLEILGQSI